MNKLFNYFILGLIASTLIIILFFNNYYIYIKGILWAITTTLILLMGVYLSFKLNFRQLKLGKIIKSIFDKNVVGAFNSLAITLGAKIGVGSLAGISLAIYLGGPGTIFWLWISSIIMAINTYAESYLLVKYNKYDSNLVGPSKYIYKGLNNKFLVITYSIIVIFAYIVGFIPIQANTIVKSVVLVSDINKWLVSILLIIIVMVILFRSANYIIKVCTILVPFMTILYVILGIYIVITNFSLLTGILVKIFKDALTIRSILPSIIVIGIQRGLFATETGIGTSALSISNKEYDAYKVGLSQIFGIHVTTFLICTVTALIILTSNYNNFIFDNINGIEIITMAFNYHLGGLGSFFLVLITVLFALSTIISGYYYGEVSAKNIFPNINRVGEFFIKLITILLVIMGCIVSSGYIWDTIDILIAFMAIINIYAIWRLKDKVK